MNFELTEDQQLLRDSIRRVVEDEYPFETRQRDATSATGFGEKFWRQGAELGWNAIPFAEDVGGFGAGPEEVLLVMEALGRGLVPSPYWNSIVWAGGILSRTGDERIGSLIDGTEMGTVAFAEPRHRFDVVTVDTVAEPNAGGWRVRGSKLAVPYGGSADWIIVPARASSQPGLGLFLVPRDAQGVKLHDYATFDGQRAANIEFRDVSVSNDGCVADFDAGASVLQAVADEATFALAAEAVGIVDAVMETTLDYTRNRKQFGQPIGSFQALQHRMVDMFMTQTQLRSLLYRAAISLRDAPDVARADVAAVKYYVGGPVRKLGQEAIQLHGGMGMTWEMAVAHYFKRLTAIDLLMGNADEQLGRYVALRQNQASPP